MPERSLDEKVLDWLRWSGFPFELEGRRFLKAGWSIAHGQPYEDPVEQKLREIDLYASRFCIPDDDESHSLSFVLAIECKSSPKSNPWVAFVDATPRRSRAEITVPEGIGRTLLLRRPRPELLGRDTFTAGSSMAHNLIEVRFTSAAGEQQSDPTYKAALACANAAVARSNENESTLIDTGTFRHVQIVIPVVVVNTPLYRYSLNEDGEEVLERQGWVQVGAESPHGRHVNCPRRYIGKFGALCQPGIRGDQRGGTHLLKELPDAVEQFLKRHGAWRPV